MTAHPKINLFNVQHPYQISSHHYQLHRQLTPDLDHIKVQNYIMLPKFFT